MINLRQYQIYVYILFLVFGTAAFIRPDTDDPVLKTILNKIETFNKNNSQEKIFVQTDKTYYAAGDTIWFKGYVRTADQHTPTELSNILHVILVTGDNKEIQNRRLEIKDGLTAGYLVVPPNADPGNYRLVAYTRWMRNYDARFSYVKQLSIYNFNKNIPASKTVSRATAQVNFFPEGGYLVYGLESKLAFKATDSTGKSMPITGSINDNNGKAIISFRSSESGLGNFILKPETGKTYVATVKTPDSKTFTVALPKPLETGYVMQAYNKRDSLCIVTVQKTNAACNTAPEKVFLVVKSRDKVFFAEAKSFGNKEGKLTFDIVKSNIPEGVAQLTLFSQDGKPQCERLIYVRYGQKLNITLKPNKQFYAPREDVTVDVEVTDKNGVSVPANLSVSVTDENALLTPTENILSYLYLGSNVTGEIENATTYFANDLPETKLALDNLLLTQGWRRFTWLEMLSETEVPKKYTPEKDLVFKGHATTADGKAMPATLLNILMSGTGNAYSAFTDTEGNFSVILPDYETSGSALFRFFRKDNALPGIKVTPTLEPITNWLPVLATRTTNGPYTVYWQKAYDWFRIQKAYYGINSESERTESANLSQSALFKKGQTGTTSYNVDDYVQFKDMAELFDEAIEPVTLKKTQSGLESRVYSRQLRKYFTNSPLYIVDGKPTFDNNVVLSLPIEQIAEIEVFNTPEHLSRFSLMGRDGVIAIYTKASNLDLQNLSDSAVPFEGIFSGREFYQAPLKPTANAALPAFRPRLYWQSDIKTDANGKAQLTFKNADDITKYRVVVEGITTNGLPGVGEVIYQVIKPN